MRVKKKTDRRTRRTRHSLTHAMVDLVTEKRFDDITVQNLIDRADIGRSTFYTHFRDKEDLFQKNWEGFLEFCVEQIDWTRVGKGSFFPVLFLFDHLKDVQETDGRRSHWVAKGPMAVPVEWDAEIINDVPSELISWKTFGDSDVANAGSVRFRPAPGGNGTEVRVKLQYDPPAGKVGATVAWMLGDDPQQAIEEDLQRFKQIVEGGEESLSASAQTERTRTGTGKRARRDREGQPASIVTEPLTTP